MSIFNVKTWVNRVSEHPNRRTLTDLKGTATTYDVSKNEGTVSTEGDAFSAANMNDLESRVSAGIEKVNMPQFTATYTVAGWTVSGDGTYWTQSKAVTGMTSTMQLSCPMNRHTGTNATDEAFDKALGIVNRGIITSNSGSVLIKVWEKPTVDIDVYWTGKETA